MFGKFFLYGIFFTGVILSPLLVQAQIHQSDVVVETLPELSLNAMGIVPTNNVHLWSGTPAEELKTILHQLKKANLTPAQRSFVSYLMAVDTTGANLNDVDKIWGTSTFLYERLSVLKSLGEFDIALEIINKIPENDMTSEIDFLAREIYLMKGNIDKACQPFPDLKSDVKKDKLQISCYLAKEEKDKAVLAYDIFQETYPDSEQTYKAIADSALLDMIGDLPDDIVLTPLDVYLISLIKNPKIDWRLQSRAIKKTLTELPTTDILFRIELGERIGLSLDSLKRLYGLPLLNPDLNNKTVQRVTLYKQILETTDSKEKGRLLKSFLSLIKQDKLLIPMAGVIAELFYPIEPNEDNKDLAFDAVQMFALTNNAEMAEPWYQLLKQDTSEIYQKQFLKATPLMHTLGNGYPYNLSELMIKFCSVKSDEDCYRLKQILPPESYQTDTENIQDSDSVLILPHPEALNTRLGESFLKAILNIANNQFIKETSRFIKKVARPNEGNAVLREGMIFE